jgi:hypothetical protein
VGNGVRVGWGFVFPLVGIKGLGLLSMTIQAAEVNKTATTTNAITVIVFNSIQPRQNIGKKALLNLTKKMHFQTKAKKVISKKNKKGK